MPPNAPRSRPVVQDVTQVLRSRVIHGQYPAGAPLPSERALAAELGVSRMTISRALALLAGERIVEQRVGAGSRVCPDAARRLPPGGIAILHQMHSRPASAEMTLILQGVLDTLAAQRFSGETVPVAGTDYRGPVERAVRAEEIPRLQGRYGGFLFIEGFCPGAVHALQQRGVPLVVANMENALPEVSATWVDHHRIACTAVEMLAAMGHRRIGLVATVPGGHAFYGATVRGYRDGLARAGLPVGDRLVSLCTASSPLEAYLAAGKLLSLEPAPTAVVAGRDLHAEGICRAAQERALVIGRDLSVIGFDDTSWPSSRTFLTTFREPCYELGAEAAAMLIATMRRSGGGVERREIPVPLLLRRSAGPAAGCIPDGAGPPIRLQRLEG